MKTVSKKRKINFLFFLLGIFVIPFMSCNCVKNFCQSTICSHSKKIYTKDRVYYNFQNKMIFEDAALANKLQRPLVMRDNSEIQVEIRNFNPLKHVIAITDTAYDFFNPNIDDFNKLIVVPSNFLADSIHKQDLGKTIQLLDTSNKNVTIKEACNPIDYFINQISNDFEELKNGMVTYKTYLAYLENINNYYKYLNTMDSINAKIVESGIDSSIIYPINKFLPANKKLGKSSSTVFSSNFINLELYFYNKVDSISQHIKTVKSRLESFDKAKLKKCNTFTAKKKAFDQIYSVYSSDFKAYDSLRTNTILPSITKIMLVYEKLQNLAQKNPVFVTKSVPIEKDVQTINIYLYSPDKKTKEIYDAINIQMTRSFRLDVSAGIFASGLYDEKYSLFSKDSIFTTQYLNSGSITDTLIKDKFSAIYLGNGTKVSYGGMVYMQGHSQNVSLLNWGGYVGLGAMFNDQTRWAGAAGLSMVIGRKQRCFINMGAIISQVDRLTKPYEIGKFYNKSFDAIPTTKVWNHSFMVGISWKIAK